MRDDFDELATELNSLAAFFEASFSVPKARWTLLIQKLDLPRRHPGIRSVGFAPQVGAEEAGEFVQRLRGQNHGSLLIHPASTQAVIFPTVFFTRFPTNDYDGLGWDSYSDPLRRTAIQDALRSGRPAATGKLD